MKNIHPSSDFWNDRALNIQFIKKIIVQTHPTDITQLRRFQLHLLEISDPRFIVGYLHNDGGFFKKKGQIQF